MAASVGLPSVPVQHTFVRESAPRGSRKRYVVTRAISSIEVTPARAFCEAVLAHRDHALGAGDLGDLGLRGSLHGQRLDLVAHHHHREEADAAAVAAVAAAGAAHRLVGLEVRAHPESRTRPGPAAGSRCAACSRCRAGARGAGRPRTRRPTRSGSSRCPSRPGGRSRPARRWCAACVSTMWPVSAASIAIRAVSASRISPTMITSGSARRIERSPVAKVEPGLAVDVHLVDAGDPVLDRVLDRDDVALDRRSAPASAA